MKNNIFIIMKKEFARFFGDKRMLFTSMIMPGLLLFLIYSLMGGAFSSMGQDTGDGGDVQYNYMYTNNLAAAAAALGAANAQDIQQVAQGDLKGVQDDIQNGSKGLLIVFPEGGASGASLYYNSSSAQSVGQYQTAVILMSKTQTVDLAGPAEDPTSKIFATLLPMLLMIFFFSSCVALAPESIAGEKERGTIATLLVTPIKSWQLAAGKILSLAVMALLGGLISAAGAVLGLSRMIAAAGEASISVSVWKGRRPTCCCCWWSCPPFCSTSR